MIILCEPQCSGYSHEQFNAGTLYGYSLAYPDEKIIFFAEKEHIKCIQKIYNLANLSFKNIEFFEMNIPESKKLASILVIFKYYSLLKYLLNYASDNNCYKIAFLSIYTFNLLPLKYLIFKLRTPFKFNIAMHGTLEFIKRKNILFHSNFINKIINRIKSKFNIITEINNAPVNNFLYEKLFTFSLKIQNKNIKYFVFRDDIPEKIRIYLPTIYQHFKSIDLPYIFKDTYFLNSGVFKKKIVFATIGQGDLNSIYKIVDNLSQISKISNKYEIRIIGGNNRKNIRNEYTNVVHYGDNLSRDKIEHICKEVNYFLFFYNSEFYELTTSGSFFDAIAYCKPIIFLKNNCFDFYYQKYNFGYRCSNITEMINVLTNIIVLNDANYKKHISEIIRMRNDISIKNNYTKLKFV